VRFFPKDNKEVLPLEEKAGFMKNQFEKLISLMFHFLDAENIKAKNVLQVYCN